ncbi:MAG: hypothetical protein LBS62_13535 [Clostridiales bacterium]|nr:hypothetical protein [Clostridiales bacterium]
MRGGTISNYPGVTEAGKIQAIVGGAGVHLEIANPNVKRSVKYALDLNKGVENYRFISCGQFNKCTVFQDRKLYRCLMPAHIDIFNEYFGKNVEVTEAGYIVIFKAGSCFENADFLSKPVPFCGYCAVDKQRVTSGKQEQER